MTADVLKNASILITGGTGSFGGTFVPMTLAKYNPRRLVIFSRDEMKQWDMAKLYSKDERVRFFVGDVRDRDRLARAMEGVEYVVHAAATKIVPTAEYNPFCSSPLRQRHGVSRVGNTVFPLPGGSRELACDR